MSESKILRTNVMFYCTLDIFIQQNYNTFLIDFRCYACTDWRFNTGNIECLCDANITSKNTKSAI